MSNLKLYYFDMPGRAETIRLAATVGGVEFEDVRFSREDWQEKYKPTMPFEQVPVLEVDGKKLAQGSAILRFVGKLGGLYPSDAFLAAKVDEFMVLLDDFGQAQRGPGGPGGHGGQGGRGGGGRGRGARTEPPTPEEIAAREERMKKLKEEHIPKFGAFIEKTISANGTGFPVGDGITIADLQLYRTFKNTTEGGRMMGGGAGEDAFDAFPLLKQAALRVKTHPKVVEFEAKHAKPAEAPAAA